MKLVRIVLMGLGAFYAATFTLNFFQTLDQNQRYLTTKSTVSNTVETVQANVTNTVQSVQSGAQAAQSNVTNSIENVQAGSSSLVSQFDDNALFIMLGVLFLLFILRRSFRRVESQN